MRQEANSIKERCEMDEKIMMLDCDRHLIGDKECKECWSGYPKKCECGGLIHASFGDEDCDENYWLYTKCDKCGESE